LPGRSYIWNGTNSSIDTEKDNIVTDFSHFETLLVEFKDLTAYVTLNRPETRNAMNFKMVEELTTLFQGLRENRGVRAIVLSGAGGTFCSGGDIKEMRENRVPDENQRVNLDVMLRACNQASQVIIAKIEGAALGGGFGLACVSDIAIASEDAQFGLPEVRLGVSPAFISPFVIQRVGLTRARELMLSGRRFNGAEAARYHIVSYACPAAEVDTCLQRVLDEIAQGAPGAIAATKELIFTVLDAPLDDTVEYRANLLNRLRQSEEAQEGMMAFIQKRPARWVTGG
jgi:isohexenylglutaconyl-CoA hydratase